MTAHDPALCPPKKRKANNKNLFARVAKCHNRAEKGFEKALDAAVELLKRAMSNTPSADEARRLLNTLSLAQRKLYDLPNFIFDKRADT